jgi:hypothetical protein
MKHLKFCLALMSVAGAAIGQEFKIHANGLMYSEQTMGQLSHIVDSLNLKYRYCERNKTYRSKEQARAHYVSLDKGKISEARKDLQRNIPFEEFIAKYPDATVEKELVVIKFHDTNNDDEEVVEYTTISFKGKFGHTISVADISGQYGKDLRDSWLVEYREKSRYSAEAVEAFYFLESFRSSVLPADYAAMVQYADCMVDTSKEIFHYQKDDDPWARSELPPKARTFLDYTDSLSQRPVRTEGDTLYWNSYNAWNESRFVILDKEMAFNFELKKMFEEALKEVESKGGSDDKFEEYVWRYHSPAVALEMKRNRRVVGFCSMDNGPRIHAMNIAMLSAETVNWEVFLRAHLDIMNDNFQRVSDGSYAWKGRKTYIRELEELDINVHDLLLGIALRIENPGRFHYYGDIGRIGRAFAETETPDVLESRMLNMLRDNGLDDFNRILIYYLYRNYNYSLVDKTRQQTNRERLKETVQALPEYLSSKMMLALNEF